MMPHVAARRYALPALLLAALICAADQASKWWMMTRVLAGETPGTFQTVVLTPWANLVLVWNRGISFGLFDTGAAGAGLVLAGLTGLVTLGLIAWIVRATSARLSYTLGLIVGGAVGNIIDRLRFGAVVDFLDLHVRGLHWPAFNVADAAIVAGAFLLALDALLCGKGQTNTGGI